MNSVRFLVIGSKRLREGLLIASCPEFLCLHINRDTLALGTAQEGAVKASEERRMPLRWPKRHKGGYVKKKKKKKKMIDAAEGTVGTDFPCR